MRLAETIFVDCVEIAHAQPLQTCYVRPDPPRPGSRPRRPGIRAADHGRGQACCGSPSAIWDAGRCSSKWPIDRRRSRASTERPGARSGFGRAPRSPAAPSWRPRRGFAPPEAVRTPARVRPRGAWSSRRRRVRSGRTASGAKALAYGAPLRSQPIRPLGRHRAKPSREREPRSSSFGGLSEPGCRGRLTHDPASEAGSSYPLTLSP
jgi:hypothetical protein